MKQEQAELFFLWHPGTANTFSGYGLTTRPGRKDILAGLLMVDRPRPVASQWLEAVEAAFGKYQLVPMTGRGERGIVCQMQVAPDSLVYLRQFPGAMAEALKGALAPLLAAPPTPAFVVRWDEAVQMWRSHFSPPNELPQAICQVFAQTGYGCLATETDIGVVHACHAADGDIEGFAGKLVWYQWQLIQMPTAPLIRLELIILDNLDHPFKFESFLNVADEEQARILDQLVKQDRLYLAFYGDGLVYRLTRTVVHSVLQRLQLEQLVSLARRTWDELPPARRDFDRAKAEFLKRFI